MATLSMAAPWKDPRTGIWHFRRRVPQTYRKALALPETMKWSLGTADRRSALAAWPAALIRWEALLAEWERRLKVEGITEERAEEIAALWTARILAGAPLKTSDPAASSETFAPLHFPEQRTDAAVAALQRLVAEHTDEALAWAGITASPETLPVLRGAMLWPTHAAYLRAGLGTHMETTAEGAAEPGERAQLAAGGRPAGRRVALSLDGIYERWKAVASVAARTKAEVRYHIGSLKKSLGHDDAADVTTADVRRWRDALKDEGLNNNTVNARTGGIRAVFQRAVDDQLLEANPVAASLRLPKVASVSPRPYTVAEARRILLAARQAPRTSIRWGHWLMAFTGMRAGEALQLKGKNIQRDGAVWFIEVTDRDPDQSVKNGESRNVPIHAALIEEGFVEFAQTIAADAPLFPDKRPDVHGQRGGRAWQVLGRWVHAEAGITEPGTAPDHSWRHYIEDALRDAEVPEDVRDAITGRVRRTSGRKYGAKGEALARLARGLSALPSPLDAECRD